MTHLVSRKLLLFKTLALLLIFNNSSFCYGQTWIDLKDPRSDVLGRGVSQIKDGTVTFMPDAGLTNPAIDTAQSADLISDYSNKYRKFITLFSSSEKFNVTNVEIRKASIKSININDVAQMKTGINYVYEAYSADSFVLTISRKKEVKIDYSKAINTIFKQLNKSILTGAVMDKISDVLPILDSIKSEKKDSIVYKITVNSSHVYFKIRVIKFNDVVKHDWDKYFKYFDNLVTKTGIKSFVPLETKDLKLDALSLETLNQYPEFWGKNDNTNVRVKFGMKKTNGVVKLYVYHTENVASNSKWIAEELEPSFIDDKNLGHWNVDRHFVYGFYYQGRRKLIYVNIIADQVDGNTIRIINWTKENGNYLPKTFMKYPEINFEYVNG